MRKITNELNSLFWTQFFGAFIDNLFKSALVILITYKAISLFGVPPASMVAMCGGVFILPYFFASATAGEISDKFNKAWLCHRIKEFEVVIAALGIFGLYIENYYLMLFVLFLLGLQSTFFGPIKYSLIPDYTKSEDLVYANALVSSGTFVAILLGTIVGGISVGGNYATYPLMIILMMCSLVGLYFAKRLPYNKDEIKRDSNLKVNWNFFTSTKNILSLVFKDKKILLLVVGLSWFWFLGAGLLSLLPTLAKDVYKGTESVAIFMLFVFTLGMGIGPFVIEKLTKGKIIAWIIPVSLFLMSLVIIDLSYLVSGIQDIEYITMIGVEELFTRENSIRIVIDLFLLSFFGGMFTVPQFAMLQNITKHTELSRIVAGNNILNSLTMVLVSVMLMVLHQIHMPIALIFFVFGVLNILFCIYLFVSYKEELSTLFKK